MMRSFRTGFGHDKILDELDDELNEDAYAILLSTLNFKVRYNGKTYNNLTPIKWAYLWCIENPLVKKMKNEPTQADVDLFFYILANEVEDVDIKAVLAASLNYCENNSITTEEAIEVAHIVVSQAFAPLKMFPHNDNVKAAQDPVFDADWLTAIVAKVQPVTGMNATEIMTKLSLTACCYYYAQYARMQGTQHIEKRPSNEIMVAKNNRTCELILDRFEELKITKPEERAELYKIMTSPPDK